jgi:hypothetical protein
MTTVKALREFLAQLPDEAEVRVLKEVTSGYNTYTKWVPLELPKTAELAPYGSDTLSCDGNTVDLGNS